MPAGMEWVTFTSRYDQSQLSVIKAGQDAPASLFPDLRIDRIYSETGCLTRNLLRASFQPARHLYWKSGRRWNGQIADG